ncbi:Endoglucanase a [Globisporangium polare]
MRVPAITTACLLSLLLAGLSSPVHADPTVRDSELVLLLSLSRHGSRAPNLTVKKHCPNNVPNMNAYHVPPEQLTERGMVQMEATGRHVRQVYVGEKKFLSPSFNSDDHSHFEAYFRADAANRCGQSAISLGYGLYPDGTGPAGYEKQPIPVYMQLSENEHDFTANGPCWTVMQEHAKHHAATRGKQLIIEHTDALASLAKVCGNEFYSESNGGDEVVAIKDVADMFLFDRDEGLTPTPGLTTELADELSQLAFQNLMERLYSTPREITTAIGGFPQLLLRTLNNAAAPEWSRSKSTKYFSFHGHRELLHGLGLMMGMKFNFGAGMPAFNGSTALHPGTTLFFELHRQQASNAQTSTSTTSEQAKYFVKLFVWSPQSPRTAVKLDNCALECPLQDLSALIQTHISQTGAWQDICNYHPVNVPRPFPSVVTEASEEATLTAEVEPQAMAAAEAATEAALETTTTTLAAAAAAARHEEDTNLFARWLITAGGFSVLGALCATTFQRMNKRREYLSL